MHLLKLPTWVVRYLPTNYVSCPLLLFVFSNSEELPHVLLNEDNTPLHGQVSLPLSLSQPNRLNLGNKLMLAHLESIFNGEQGLGVTNEYFCPGKKIQLLTYGFDKSRDNDFYIVNKTGNTFCQLLHEKFYHAKQKSWLFFSAYNN